MKNKILLLVFILFAFTVKVGGAGVYEQLKEKGYEVSYNHFDNWYANKKKRDNFKKILVKNTTPLLGIKYVWGGESSEGLDCSGLTKVLFNKINIDLPHYCKHQMLMGKEVSIDSLEVGDLLFFNKKKKWQGVGHVAMVLDVKPDTISFVQSVSKGVEIDTIGSRVWNHYFEPRFVKVKRLF